jgi:hypothetical protein
MHRMQRWRARNWRGELEIELDPLARASNAESSRALVDGLVWEAYTVGDAHAARIVDEVYAALRGPDRAVRRGGAEDVRRELGFAAQTGVLRVLRIERAAYAYELPEREPSIAPRFPPPPPAEPAPAEEPPLELELDLAAQVAALKAAAKDGAPFCEECERQRLRSAQERRGSV